MDFPDSPEAIDVQCPEPRCDAVFVVKRRKIILNHTEYYRCGICQCYFPDNGRGLTHSRCITPSCQSAYDKFAQSFVDFFRLRDVLRKESKGTYEERRIEEDKLEKRTFVPYPHASLKVNAIIDIVPRHEGAEEEIRQLLGHGLSLTELQAEIAGIFQRHGPPPPSVPPKRDLAKEMEADILTTIKEGRASGKSPHEINAEIEYIKQQNARG